MHHLIYSPETVATLWECSSLATLWKHQEVPADSKGNPKQNLHSLKLTSTNPSCMVIHHIIWEMKELKRRSCLIPLSSLSTRNNFKACHWRSRTSLECTLMYSMELGSFQDLHTSSSSNQMQSQWDMHQDMFQFIYRKLSTRKSGTWSDMEFWSQLKRWVNGWMVL